MESTAFESTNGSKKLIGTVFSTKGYPARLVFNHQRQMHFPLQIKVEPGEVQCDLNSKRLNELRLDQKTVDGKPVPTENSGWDRSLG